MIRGKTGRTWRRRGVASAVAGVALICMATSCSSNTGVSTAGARTGGEVPADVQANVDAFMQKPTSIGITEPLKSKPAGKSVAWIGSGTQNDNTAYGSFAEAAAVLNMKATKLEAGADPQKAARAIEQARSQGFDAVVLSGLVTSSVGPQLAALHDSGVKVVGYSTSLEGHTGPSIDFSFYSLPEARRFGGIAGDWTIADSGAAAKVLIAYPPDIAAAVAQRDGFADRLKDKCPSCEVKDLEFSFSELGGALPSRIVSAVQADPDIDYVFGTFGGVFVGVPEALRQAGLADRVKGVTVGGTPANMIQITDGNMLAASLDQGLDYTGYMVADAVARVFAGQEVPVDVYRGLDMPVQLHTADNIDFDPTTDWSGEPQDFREQFTYLWDK
ncbi:substrate-binding protein domain-containing protein [Rhodococcus jostii]|uniref:Substrate-binding protein domain-containing protein n=1 Tax=Rhodococcus jostii TaxID=132919 RepID=A0A1H4ILV2_RHOJO|nr:substrate-binding protein domain-containing protein [Rhodococcus jostii]